MIKGTTDKQEQAQHLSGRQIDDLLQNFSLPLHPHPLHHDNSESEEWIKKNNFCRQHKEICCKYEQYNNIIIIVCVLTIYYHYWL